MPLHDVGGVVGGPCSCRDGADCRSAGKHPRTGEGWQRPENLVRTEIELFGALERWPSCNWGLATGLISGVWALDFDPKNVTDRGAVDAFWAQLATDRGLETWSQRTGSGGSHLVFALPEDFVPNNGPGRLPDGFDVRGSRRGEAGGGQIVLAPSVSAVGPYMPLPGAATTMVRSAPAWLEDLIRPTPPRVRVDVEAWSAPEAAIPRYAIAAVNGELRELRGTLTRRNDRAWRAAARCIELANGAGLDHEQVYAAWWAAAAAHPDPAVTVPDRELLSVWASAERTVGDRPADLSGVGGPSSWAFGGVGVVPFAVPGAVPPSGGSAPGGNGAGGSVPPAPMLGVAGGATAAIAPVAQTIDARESRRVDLGPYLRGDFKPPQPSYGGFRSDDAQLLYPGRWHTAIALNAAGKSWFGLWHCLAELRRGSTVAYLHFEESSPLGTIERLREMGAEDHWLDERFVWMDTNTRWGGGELETELGALDDLGATPVLLILDGINAACSQHGWTPDKTEAVGAYRAQFVTPAASRGTAVLSLGHPPKARDRQNERHGFGSTAWLDEVDGVGFRLEASTRAPFRRGSIGYTNVYSVKDRYGEVERHGSRVEKGDSTWYDLGALRLDGESVPGRALLQLNPPAREEGPKAAVDPVDAVAEVIVKALMGRPQGPSYGSHVDLKNGIRAAGLSCDDKLVPAAVERLVAQGRVEESTAERGARRGHLIIALEALSTSVDQDPIEREENS